MAYELRMSDWSSAVCSSDLTAGSLDRAPPLGQCGGDFCTCEGLAAVADGADKTPLSFQDMILTLHNYWSARGCAILQPYAMRVGAGTLHPATPLRSQGPGPWDVPYVPPHRRPTDGPYRRDPHPPPPHYRTEEP